MNVFKRQGHFDMVVGSRVHYSIIKSCVFILSFLVFLQHCAGSGWDGGNFLHSRLHDAVFWICD